MGAFKRKSEGKRGDVKGNKRKAVVTRRRFNFPASKEVKNVWLDKWQARKRKFVRCLRIRVALERPKSSRDNHVGKAGIVTPDCDNLEDKK